jgi:hypothetical protein
VKPGLDISDKAVLRSDAKKLTPSDAVYTGLVGIGGELAVDEFPGQFIGDCEMLDNA